MSIFDDDLEPRPGKSIPAGRSISPERRSTLIAVTRQSPEVMVKVMPGKVKNAQGKTAIPSPRDRAGLRGLVAYMGKEGGEVENESGICFSGSELRDATKTWRGIPDTKGKRMEVRHVILSMPEGTDKDDFAKAAKSFASHEFKGHQYLIALHNDTGRPHAHIAVKVGSIDGQIRMRVPKQKLQQWRESFSERLWEQGIESSATSRLDRISTRQDLSQGLYQHLKKQKDGSLEDRLNGRMNASHKHAINEYRKDIQLLRQGTHEDQQLAVALERFVDDRTQGRGLER